MLYSYPTESLDAGISYRMINHHHILSNLRILMLRIQWDVVSVCHFITDFLLGRSSIVAKICAMSV